VSESFSIGRGCRQGDPISPYIFILCAELLAIKIKHCKDIKGITVNGIEYKISQFADDTSLLLDGSEHSLNSALNMLDDFALFSGLKVNFDKTHVIWIGALKYSTRSIKSKYKLTWGTTSFKLLGVIFDVDLKLLSELNFSEKFTKANNVINQWKKRKLTPIGRITVIKSLILPLFTHCFFFNTHSKDRHPR